MENPRSVLLGALIVLGALHALADLFGAWDRLRMETDTTADLEQLPTTEHEDGAI